MMLMLINIWFTICIFIIQLLIVSTTGNIDDGEYGNIINIEAVQGTMVKLPCNITSTIANDKITLVIWYKNNSESPIYSFDSRDTKFEKGSHWSNQSVLNGRGYFEVKLNPGIFIIDAIKSSDSGLYRCRVDFQRSPTRNSKVNLYVIIPPENILILDDDGAHIPHYILGPYNEGATVNLTCQSTGGRPQPKLTWWHENELIDDSYNALSEKKVQNLLHFHNLTRHHLHTSLTCQASNNNITTPISSAVTLNVNLKPLWVKMQGDNRALSAGGHYELLCEVVGSRPAPVITWWMGSVLMKNSTDTTTSDGNTTISTLKFSPTIDDGGKYLCCRGVQPLIAGSGMESGWTLVIHHVPVVSLELGTNVNASSIREGADVYFECNIKSTPWVYKVNWRHNGKFLYNNAAAGITVSNLTLVLQNVTRARSGIYTCIGSNKEGDAESNAVHLDIRFAPLCRPGLIQIYNVARHETAKIICELEANPYDVNFTWKFNTTISETIDLPSNLIAIDRTKSIAHYTPIVEQDYGTLLCWGNNDIGTQSDPCIFNIIPAGRPDPLSNCTVSNQTLNVLQLECIEGFDGGLPQTFEVQVFYGRTKNLVTNQSSTVPFFALKGLRPEYGYDIVLSAKNAKGKSTETILHMYTLNGAEKHTDEFPSLDFLLPYTGSTLQIKLVLGAFVGLIFGILLILLTSLLIIRVRRKNNKNTINIQMEQQQLDTSSSMSTACVQQSHDLTSVGGRIGNQQLQQQDYHESGGGTDGGIGSGLTNSTDSLEKNPDIIPHGKEDNQFDDDGNLYQWPNQRTYVTAALATQCGVNNSFLAGGGGSGNNINGGMNKIPSTHHHHLNHPTQTNYMINPHYSVASSDINSPTLIINQQQQPQQQQQQQQHLFQNPSSAQNLKFNNQIQYTSFNSQQHLQQLHNQQQKQQLQQQQQQQMIKTSINNRENSNNNDSNCADDEDIEDDDCDDNSSITIDNHTTDDNQKKTKELTYAELSLVIPKQKAIYTSATLGRPRNKDTRINEPTIYAQFDLAHQQRQILPINGYPNISWMPTSQMPHRYDEPRMTPIVSSKETHSTLQNISENNRLQAGSFKQLTQQQQHLQQQLPTSSSSSSSANINVCHNNNNNNTIRF